MDKANREKLIKALDKAVENDEISEKEARAELRAYEAEMRDYDDWCNSF